MSTLSLADVRWRSRRDPAGGPPLLHVAFLADAGDRRTAAIVAGICDYAASLVGRPRREYDTDVPVEIAGDRRLGNGLASACLGWYRWTARTFAEALPAHVADALERVGVDGPPALRLRLFDLVNERYAGFVPSGRREEALAALAASLDLAREDTAALDVGMTLDAEQEAVLVAAGPAPSVPEVIARYNRALLAAVLRQAERIVFTVREPDGALVRRLYAFCRLLGVYCDVETDSAAGGFRLTLAGPDAVVGPPAAAGPRLTRVALRLLRRLGPDDSGVAHLLLRERPYRLALDRTLLRIPGLVIQEDDRRIAESDDDTTYDATEPSTAADSRRPAAAYDSEVEAHLARAFAALRRQGRAAGWRLVREPAPLIAGGRVLIPDFALVRGELRVFVEIVGFWTPGYIEKKRRALERLSPDVPLILAVSEGTAAPLTGLPFPLVPYRDTVPLQHLLDAAEARYGDFAARITGAAERLAAACRAAEASGWLGQQELARALGCHTPGEVQRVLAAHPPPAGWDQVPGAGLCGSRLAGTIITTLDGLWAAAGPDAVLSLQEVRDLLPSVNLPDGDEALALLLARLPACMVVRGSLFALEVRPPDYIGQAEAAAPLAAARALSGRRRRAASALRRRDGAEAPTRPSLF